ncbi:MAG: arginine--tRNA ligase [Chitinispirillia bacterium]|jgi:arginyl-tRNA synthetase
MASIQAQISAIFSSAFQQCGFDGSFGIVKESQRPDLGQFQCNGALALAKSAKKNPRVIARDIVNAVSDNPTFSNLSIEGPGFINISLSDQFIADHCNSIKNDTRMGCHKIEKSQTVIIDFSSPNIAKPMHVGHLRSIFLGDSFQRLFNFLGYNVISDNHIGDWGTPIGMLITELKRRNPDLPYFDEKKTGSYPEKPPITISELEDMYPYANRRCTENENAMAEAIKATEKLQSGRKGYISLWKHFVNLSVTALKADYNELNISFDYWLGESFYADRMKIITEKLKKNCHAIISDGALIMPIMEGSDQKEIPPLMLVKSGGGFLYSTSDLATIDYRVEKFNPDKILYVVDQRQHLHFSQVFRAAKKSGIAHPGLFLKHIGFGTINGKDGKPFKTRTGGVMKLKDLISLVIKKAEERMKEANIAQDFKKDEQKDIAEKVCIAALKYADLMNHRMSDYIFDIDKFCRFEGKTGPYLLYTAVRIKSILRKANEQNIPEGDILPPANTTRSLMLILSQLPDVLYNASEGFFPNYICDFAFSLAQEFNRFYKECHILNEECKTLQRSWLSLCKICLKELELALGLLGIEIPDRM